MLPAAQKLMAFIERIERLEEERKSLADDIADVYRELAGDGYDKDATKVIVKIRRTDDGLSKWRGASETVDFYLSSLGMLGPVIEDRAPARTREIIEKIDAETGEITEQEQPETANEVPAQDGGGTATGEGPGDKSNAAHPVSEQELADADLNDGTAAGQTAIEVVTDGESAAIISPSAAPPAEAVAVAPQPSHAATAAIPEGIPAFLLKERKPLRPNCLNPENCAGYGSYTCHRCTRAMAESEAA